MNFFLAALEHLLSAVFPGSGHFLVRRPLRAAVLATVFFCCFEGVLLSVFLEYETASDIVLQSFAAVGIFIWLFAHMDLFRIRRLHRAAAGTVFVDGIRAFLRGDLKESEKMMRQLISADPYDVEARMYLSLVYAEAGALRASRRQLRLCSRHDEKGVLEWETQTQREWLKNRKTAS